MTWSSSARSSS
jgi:hypothetical protein